MKMHVGKHHARKHMTFASHVFCCRLEKPTSALSHFATNLTKGVCMNKLRDEIAIIERYSSYIDLFVVCGVALCF